MHSQIEDCDMCELHIKFTTVKVYTRHHLHSSISNTVNKGDYGFMNGLTLTLLSVIPVQALMMPVKL